MTFHPATWRDSCRNLTVTVRLAHGVVVDGPWPLLLDGVLSAVQRRGELADRYGQGRHITDQQRRQLDEPGEREHRPAWLADADRHTRTSVLPIATWGWHGRDWPTAPRVGAQWIWLASRAHADSEPTTELRWWHSHFGHQRAEDVCRERLPTTVYSSHGRYRSYRVPLPVTVTGTLSWRVVADPAPLLDLCRTVGQLGKKRAQGEGVVCGWTVVDEGPPDPLWVLWDAAGRIGRPVPLRAAPWLGLDDPAGYPHAIRPPYWRPPMTGTTRRWRDVIAPQTVRP